MERFSEMISTIDEFVWGPVMLILLVGTGVFLTVRTGFLPWRNLPYAIKKTLSKESRTKGSGDGDVSPFSALMTALASTIGTGNIVGVATAMVSGGPGALVWMWISACFGLSSKFSECMLSIKYREVNEKGEMSGGPMYTMRKAIKWKKLGAVLGWCFAFFAVMASFGIGNMTQANSISSAIHTTCGVPSQMIGIIITVLVFLIVVGGIQNISKVSSVVVPFMAVFYMIAGIIVIIGNIQNVPSGVAMIFKMAFSVKSVTGGVLGTVTASMMASMRYGVARGCFSNEAGLGSAAITAAAATTDQPVRQGYVNMTGTFWDTIVVCTITGLCIASSGVLGTTHIVAEGTYNVAANSVVMTNKDSDKVVTYDVEIQDNEVVLTNPEKKENVVLSPYKEEQKKTQSESPEVTYLGNDGVVGVFQDENGNVYKFYEDNTCVYEELYIGSPLTMQAFKSVLGEAGGWLVCIGIALFAFSTILGWEYHGEKAFEYLLGTHKFNILYRIVFSLIAYVGATTTIELVWNLSDIANALMAVPNLICLLLLSGEIAKDMKEFQEVIKQEKQH